MQLVVKENAKIIAALAETMTDGMWAADILDRCYIIRQALDKIERETTKRLPGER